MKRVDAGVAADSLDCPVDEHEIGIHARWSECDAWSEVLVEALENLGNRGLEVVVKGARRRVRKQWDRLKEHHRARDRDYRLEVPVWMAERESWLPVEPPTAENRAAAAELVERVRRFLGDRDFERLVDFVADPGTKSLADRQAAFRSRSKLRDRFAARRDVLDP